MTLINCSRLQQRLFFINTLQETKTSRFMAINGSRPGHKVAKSKLPRHRPRPAANFKRQDARRAGSTAPLVRPAVHVPPPKKKPELNDVVYETSVDPITNISQVGQGTYGKVYKSIDTKTRKLLAIKRLRLDTQSNWVFPFSAAREIRLLQVLDHPNIVGLNEVVIAKNEVYMAFDYVQHDLAGLMLNKNLHFSVSHIKSITQQLLSALAYLHESRVVHRDIKGSNILVTGTGFVKLADFGLARSIDPLDYHAKYTNRVITLWYRPPEILLGCMHYNFEVDIWGVGCLLVEMFLRKALFCGEDDVSQLFAIFSVLGVPSSESWPMYTSYPWYPLINALPPQPNLNRTVQKPNSAEPCLLAAQSLPSPATAAISSSHPSPTQNSCLRVDYRQSAPSKPGNWVYKFDQVFQGEEITPNCFRLASSMLQMNPLHRISARAALSSRFFSDQPLPRRMDLTKVEEWHDWEAKQRIRKENSK